MIKKNLTSWRSRQDFKGYRGFTELDIVLLTAELLSEAVATSLDISRLLQFSDI